MIDQQVEQSGLSWWPISVNRNHAERNNKPKKHHE